MTTSHSARVLAALTAGAVFLLWTATQLPDPVASHFAGSGRADAYMARAMFVWLMLGIGVGIPALIWAMHRRAVRRGKVNVPNPELWLSDTHREDTLRALDAHIAWFVVAYVVFICVAQWLVVQANAAPAGQAALDNQAFLTALGIFMAWTVAWLVSLMRRFRRRA